MLSIKLEDFVRCSSLKWGSYLLIVGFLKIVFIKVCWILSSVFGASFVMIVWCIYFLNMVCHINWLLNVETTFYSWDNLIFSWWIILYVTPIFMKNSRLQFYFLMMSLFYFGIKMILASSNEFRHLAISAFEKFKKNWY